MTITGTVFKFGDHVDTDGIIPARYLNTSDPGELGRHCMEDIDASFSGRVKPGDIIMAGENFGCGSSREHAPIAVRAAGIRAVIASSFARIFFRNAVNIGLPILECPEAVAQTGSGDHMEIDPASGRITNWTRQRVFQAHPLPPFVREIIQAGGLIAFTTKNLKK